MSKVNVTIATTCLADGFFDLKTIGFESSEKALQGLKDYLESLSEGLYKKFLSAQRRVRKGTSQGVKIFYSYAPRKRRYLWIKTSYEDILEIKVKQLSIEDMATELKEDLSSFAEVNVDGNEL